MPQILSPPPTKTKPKTTSLKSELFTSPPTTQKMMQKSISTAASVIPDKKTARNPVQIGTRGTVGALILQEMDYFSRLKMDSKNTSQNPSCQHTYPRPKLGSLVETPKRKNKGSGRLLPSMCSMVEVTESKNQPKVISGFGYKNLKADVRQMQA